MRCFFDDWTLLDNFLVIVAVPVVVVVFFGTVLYHVQKRRGLLSWEGWKLRCKRLYLRLNFIIYMRATRFVFAIFTCQRVNSSIIFIHDHPNVDCSSDLYTTYLVIAIFSFLLYSVGFLLILLFAFSHYRPFIIGLLQRNKVELRALQRRFFENLGLLEKKVPPFAVSSPNKTASAVQSAEHTALPPLSQPPPPLPAVRSLLVVQTDEDSESKSFSEEESFEALFGWLLPGIETPQPIWVVFLIFFPRLFLALVASQRVDNSTTVFFCVLLLLLVVTAGQMAFQIFILNLDSIFCGLCMIHLLVAVALSPLARFDVFRDANEFLDIILSIGTAFYIVQFAWIVAPWYYKLKAKVCTVMDCIRRKEEERDHAGVEMVVIEKEYVNTAVSPTAVSHSENSAALEGQEGEKSSGQYTAMNPTNLRDSDVGVKHEEEKQEEQPSHIKTEESEFGNS
eukprot:TRINITY_DN10510_c0_g4_i4.p1 TRINITY_DN10510_c0_g4~~TRINITY_DN10510_c0_g4_i4.p1  ORF type:complete len:452 (-),score=74.52 TRINITY_DN10510_c0_g4_i4:117-1472(-)